MTDITPEIVAQHGLSPEEYERVLHAMGREPNLTELGIFSVMWSEHCSYKSSRIHLKKLPTEAPWVICGPGENAGVIDIGDGQAAIFKMESHNHPSYIEPRQGAGTGVGGILRDIFTMGARPIAQLNSLRLVSPRPLLTTGRHNVISSVLLPQITSSLKISLLRFQRHLLITLEHRETSSVLLLQTTGRLPTTFSQHRLRIIGKRKTISSQQRPPHSGQVA